MGNGDINDLWASKTATFNLLALAAVMVFTLVLMLAAAGIWYFTGFDTTELGVTGMITVAGMGGGAAYFTTKRNIAVDTSIRQQQGYRSPGAG